MKLVPLLHALFVALRRAENIEEKVILKITNRIHGFMNLVVVIYYMNMHIRTLSENFKTTGSFKRLDYKLHKNHFNDE